MAQIESLACHFLFAAEVVNSLVLKMITWVSNFLDIHWYQLFYHTDQDRSTSVRDFLALTCSQVPQKFFKCHLLSVLVDCKLYQLLSTIDTPV